MTEKEYKIISRLIDLHTSSRPSSNPLCEDEKLITKVHIEELKKDIKELLVDEELPKPTIVYQTDYNLGYDTVTPLKKDIISPYTPSITRPEFTCSTNTDTKISGYGTAESKNK